MKKSESKIMKLKEFLDAHTVASLATVSADNKAHVSTIYYFADEMLYFYFVTKNYSKKYKNLNANKSVALCITDEAKLMTVQVEGQAEVIKDGEALVKIVDRLKIIQYGNHKIENPPINKLYGSFVFYRIEAHWLRWVDYNSSWTEKSILEIKDFTELLKAKEYLEA